MRKRSSGSQLVPSMGDNKECKMSKNMQKGEQHPPDGTVVFEKSRMLHEAKRKKKKQQEVKREPLPRAGTEEFENISKI